jgi:hypothetical protein
MGITPVPAHGENENGSVVRYIVQKRAMEFYSITIAILTPAVTGVIALPDSAMWD